MAAQTSVRVFAGLYKDSVSLMQLAAKLRQRPGVDEASCIMATPANLEQVADADLAVDQRYAPSDLLVILRGERGACAEAIEAAADMLQSASTQADSDGAAFSLPLASIALGLERMPDANLALISVPGDYAAAETLKALSLGLNVMLFSDNVSVADERRIKICARDRKLLVMGPDCGTAIVNGVPLGFANVVRRGDIGLVAASGTGLQEVTCRIHGLGGGVSQALGTGGRDLSDDIGGITMLQGLQALSEDPRTRVVVLVSKPPSPAIAERILDAAVTAGKPVVVHFLGAPAGTTRRAGIAMVDSLHHAADAALALSLGRPLPGPPGRLAPSDRERIERQAESMAPTQRSVRGLFTGGTFCYEAQLVFLRHGLACRSNAPAPGAQSLDGPAQGHVFIDLGDDEYTRGRPHPMIDPALRNAAIRTQAADPATAALLFDVVLGYGAHADPTAELVAALTDAQEVARAQRRSLALIGHVCGTDGDPQGLAKQVARLEQAGVIVAGSNFEAATLAAELAGRRSGSVGQ